MLTQCNRLLCIHANYPCPGETLLCVFKYDHRSLFMLGKNCIHMGHLLVPKNIRCFIFAFSLIPSNSLPYDMESNCFVGNKNG